MAALDSSNSSIGHGRFRARPSDDHKIHDYLVKELNLAENGEKKSAKFIDRICQISLEAFWTQSVRG